MPERTLSIQYECLHPSCQVFCKKGVLDLEESFYKSLSEEATEDETFRSPTGSCRLGYNQVFRAVSVKDQSNSKPSKSAITPEASKSFIVNGPLASLTTEHSAVLKKLDLIETQVRTRDIDGLWTATSDVENDILIHSIKKEEEALFPLVVKKLSMGPALVGIMVEDHREFVSLLHAFRCGLQDGEILDGLVNSLIINLRNHISKEDLEFFPMIDSQLDDNERENLFKRMSEMEKNHEPIKAGDRSKKELVPYSVDRDRLEAEIASLKTVSSVGGEEMCCGEH